MSKEEYEGYDDRHDVREKSVGEEYVWKKSAERVYNWAVSVKEQCGMYDHEQYMQEMFVEGTNARSMSGTGAWMVR